MSSEAVPAWSATTRVSLMAVGLAAAGFFLWKILDQAKIGLKKKVWQKFKLIRKTVVTHDSRIFRFALQSPDTVLGLPVGQNIQLRFWSEKENDMIERPYTPISSDDDLGYFDLLIKIYKEGKMGQYLDKLEIGADVEMQGPKGRIHYAEPGLVKIGPPKAHQFPVKRINMIAGGTGITPMYQVLAQVVKDAGTDPNVKVEVALIFGNVSVDDILLRNELEQMNQLPYIKVYFTLDKAPPGWPGGEGYITEDMIKSQLFPPGPDTVSFLCGPPIMVKILRKLMQSKMGFSRDRMFYF